MVFKDAESMLKALKGVGINAKQIERICHHYRGIVEEQDEKMIEKEIHHSYGHEESKELHYAMVDGAMYNNGR